MLTGWRVHLKAKDKRHLTVAACGINVMPDERESPLVCQPRRRDV